MLRSESELAKFPFAPEATEYLKARGLRLEALADEAYARIVERAARRIEEAIREGIVHALWKASDNEIEILSYPVAVALVNAIGDDVLSRRYALAEAKRVYELLKAELASKAREEILHIGSRAFGWSIRPVGKELYGKHYDFALSFRDYLKNASIFREGRWKLVNKLVIQGYVYLTLMEGARLLQEEVRRRVEGKVLAKARFELPEPLAARAEQLKKLAAERLKGYKAELEVGAIAPTAFPPCMQELYKQLKEGKRLPHTGRFALTSFLLNIGMSVEEVVSSFAKLADFDLKKTLYQVEHIAGKRGSRTRYTPPSCKTLRTQGHCTSPDGLCKTIEHPLTYYAKRVSSSTWSKPKGRFRER